jgi:hypothetical protein
MPQVDAGLLEYVGRTRNVAKETLKQEGKTRVGQPSVCSVMPCNRSEWLCPTWFSMQQRVQASVKNTNEGCCRLPSPNGNKNKAKRDMERRLQGKNRPKGMTDGEAMARDT